MEVRSTGRERGEGKERIRERGSRDPKRKEKDLLVRKRGGGMAFSRKQKTGKGWLQKRRGWERKKPGGTRATLGFEVRWALGRFWATLSHTRNILFFFCKLIWQLNFENGDDCLGKIFSDNFRKIK